MENDWLDGILDNNEIPIDDDDLPSFASELSLLMEEEYRHGYNANSRDCYCGDVTLNISGHHVKPKPHRHLMSDGKSHNIRPDIVRESK